MSYARWFLDQFYKSVKGAEFFIALDSIRITLFAVFQVDIQVPQDKNFLISIIQDEWDLKYEIYKKVEVASKAS